jgi:predicted DNA-binding protein (MmcQ/YjbR family)
MSKLNFNKLVKACLSLPGATQESKWGIDYVFCVGGKMFAVFNGETKHHFGFKVDGDRFLELTDRPGITPAPYLARAKWVQITALDAMAQAEAEALLRRSYELVFAKLTRKLQQEIRHG